MTDCPYLKSDGKKCGRKVSKDEILCSNHGGRKGKGQNGGFLFEMVYPMGVSVGVATYTLYKLNNIVGEWYMDKNGRKKLRKQKF